MCFREKLCLPFEENVKTFTISKNQVEYKIDEKESKKKTNEGGEEAREKCVEGNGILYYRSGRVCSMGRFGWQSHSALHRAIQKGGNVGTQRANNTAGQFERQKINMITHKHKYTQTWQEKKVQIRSKGGKQQRRQKNSHNMN